jgi:hypothetical protein
VTNTSAAITVAARAMRGDNAMISCLQGRLPRPDSFGLGQARSCYHCFF